jgi:hypothetical protein
MIQHTIRVLCIFIVLTISISAQKQPNFAPEAYKKLGNLAGDWVGKDDEGADVKSNFKLAISNTVVMETLNASGMEEMLTKMDTPQYADSNRNFAIQRFASLFVGGRWSNREGARLYG